MNELPKTFEEWYQSNLVEIDRFCDGVYANCWVRRMTEEAWNVATELQQKKIKQLEEQLDRNCPEVGM